MSDLKSCPFCGKQPKQWWDEEPGPGGPIPTDYVITCCAELRASSEEKAVANWNQRGKLASEEARQKIVKALEKGNVKWSDHGKEYWERAGVIATNPDFTIVKVDAHFWGKWHKEKDGETFGNLSGMEINWQTVSAGFGSLTICIDNDGRLKADTEGMGKEFCRSVLAKLVETWVQDEE